MKKPAFFALILLIGCIPVAGKWNHNECSNEQIVRTRQLICCDDGDGNMSAMEAESPITRFIYTF